MNASTALLPKGPRCPVCGQELPWNLPVSRCPHCLLRQGLPSGPADLQTAPGAPPPLAPSLGWPEPGAIFGHYRIERMLGQGGMGAVFAADDLESGRRVALKVLGHRLDSPEARARFFREGRLAAAVNHPNSVYVFGTEDIAGIPVIAMELVSGGTLQEQVSRHGPMKVPETVDSVLQIIAGLEAAQRVGILHRDIKPSNCFVEPDGTVKIGDFGLSISTLVRTEPALTSAGAFLGTPAFCSPEQLRGDELTVRSDIYSLGVTLYYLLTGRHPFEAPDVVRLLATVLERRPDSPARHRPELPAGLCQIVLRCLEKDLEKRFSNYDELRNGLLPYASTAPAPATLALRLAAFSIDSVLVGGVAFLVRLLIPGSAAFPEDLTLFETSRVLLLSLVSMAVALTYFTLLEGLGGASLGKRICRFRVARLDRTVPGVPRALLRTLVLQGPANALWLSGWWFFHAWMSGPMLAAGMAVCSLLSIGMKLLVFSTARRRNGFAGWHDLASATRVIVQPAYQPRPALPVAKESLPAIDSLPQIGPYHVLATLNAQPGADLLLGFDSRLLRRVWIRRLSPGAPPVPVRLRNISRPGRVRWLAAQRTDSEAWDAYEATVGQPLISLLSASQEWGRVRFWLLDLATELRAAAQDGSAPETLDLDRVWITADGRAKLLDFPALTSINRAEQTAVPVTRPALSASDFLGQVAASALEGRVVKADGSDPSPTRVPLALHAVQFLQTLRSNADLGKVIALLQALLSAPAQVSRARRGALLAGGLALPLLAVLLVIGPETLRRSLAKAAPDLATLRECLGHYHTLRQQAEEGQAISLDDLKAFETYIAGRFGPVITNAARWNQFSARLMITEPYRTDALRICRPGQPISAVQFEESAAQLDIFFNKSPDLAAREAVQQVTVPMIASVLGYGSAICLVVVPCWIGSLLFRGGALLKLLGIVLVNRTGLPASRWRVTGRNLMAWLPFVLVPLGARAFASALGMAGGAALLLAGCAGLALLSVLLPGRGLADRLAGTWPVPR